MTNYSYVAFLILLCLTTQSVFGQKVANVTAKYTYVVGENDNVTLREARQRCVELAKAEAIKNEFGQLITSDVIDTNVAQIGTEGTQESTFFWENTVAMAKGDWLGDTREPEITVEYIKGELFFTAEVWGQAREIIQAKPDLKWSILKDMGDKRVEAADFNSGERFYVRFRSPADGYVAVYLTMSSDDETACLLPYRKDTSGKVPIQSGKDYVFFDKATDPNASYYNLTTHQALEEDQLVIIYSPNPFTKCNDITGDARHPNSLSTRDFQKWLLKCQRADREMVVDKRWVKIINRQAEE